MFNLIKERHPAATNIFIVCPRPSVFHYLYYRGNSFIEVAKSPGLEVRTFEELLINVSRISYYNPKLMLLFRGQQSDGRVKFKGESISSIFPSLYRQLDGKKISPKQRGGRTELLEQACKSLTDNYKLDGKLDIQRFIEPQWAIIQHYSPELEVQTPLADLTQSLEIAATFALFKDQKDHGYVFVFGLPHQHGSMSYHIDDRMVSVKLSATCPPPARRPHFQQAFLVGSLPHNDLKRTRSKNLARRLLAKFRIRKDGFWSKGFRPVHKDVLYPKNDRMLEIINEMVISQNQG